MAPISTTVIGSMPKPDYLNVPCWISHGKIVEGFVEDYNKTMETQNKESTENQLTQATQEIVALQDKVGLDVLTDGEFRRDQYVYGFCRKLNGFDFHHPKFKICRNGAWSGVLPKIVSKVTHGEEIGFMANEWKWSQGFSEKPMKVTIPGPLTIMDSVCDDFYHDEETLAKDLAKCINLELKKLAEAGCSQIQVDEPVLLRYSKKALSFGIGYLTECIADLPEGVFTTVHACCGFPNYLDQKDYVKSEQDGYFKLAKKLDKSGFDALSLEDQHRRNDPKLFSCFKKIKIVLGVIDIASSRVETVNEIQEHISEVLQFIPADRLIIGPDCGMLFLSLDLVEKKLMNMVQAANSVS